MQKKIILLLILAFQFSYVAAQLNSYKYFVVPTKFSTFNKENQHLTSTTVKYLFAKKGYPVYYDNAMPEELVNNRCLGLFVDLDDRSSFLTTKTAILLKDCHGVVIFETEEGRSKVKEYIPAYREAITEAFAPLNALDYGYVEKKGEREKTKEEPTKETLTVSFKNDVKQVASEKVEEVSEEVKTVEKKNDAANSIQLNISDDDPEDMLYAIKTGNGYQLFDNTTTYRMRLTSTSSPDVFLVNTDGKSGIVHKNDGEWVLELHGSKQEPQKLNIKF